MVVGIDPLPVPGNASIHDPGMHAGAVRRIGSSKLPDRYTHDRRSEKGRASIIAHEALHARLRLGGHPAARRERNPACYDGFLRQVFNVTDVVDAQCSAIVRPSP
jgi:hypothetical protein